MEKIGQKKPEAHTIILLIDCMKLIPLVTKREFTAFRKTCFLD
jgi:hypothetical protein